MAAPPYIVFAGTPVFAAVALRRLLETGYRIGAVYTQPDRPSGRGRRLVPSPVKDIAITHQLPLYQPATLKDKASQTQLAALAPDLMVVAAYGLILPTAVLQIPPLGCINIHASLLPRWRGAAPIQRALLAGDKETGISIMQMDAGLDTGPVLHTARYPIQPKDTAAIVHDQLAELGAEALLQCLPSLLEKKANTAVLQDESRACYAPKIRKEEAWLDWSQPAIFLERQVRAFNPWPVAQTQIEGRILRVWSATALAKTTHVLPGTLLAVHKTGIDIATGNGTLRLLEVQPAGKRVMTVQAYLSAHLLTPGTVLVKSPGKTKSP
ncbi:methionyl-tRNA formyltransferase [Nitrosococcus watsonii]|uniref:Methionyl-tRNA formyltransferase n=1 Tax=Nitrosococcus watsoni (strain C-113) TaxID=105559 RepID=D8K4I9_NITWC|nr:methionyl-tRNA formyltransferase [Nitrosococcus watsonii]ADJ29791.1 methionyl-tRNA formyltransferase [Nitrosococcus watsonii C-113]